MDAEAEQRALCDRYSAAFVASPNSAKIGIASNVRSGLSPINGLRHRPDSESSGWFIWAGKILETRDDFFLPLCVEHLGEWSPLARPFLGLAPGWRFLVTPDYVDVWFDETLLAAESN